ncbi:MAG: NAD-dependent epimerase/dehydratase family protein [Dehalococcoidales bacterium]|nr:NAD-dependent epimerase/dehydratase family protein [Dehalococcoidales bacterium]
MKAIVFGGSGFLGSHVADALTGAGYETTVFDVAASPYLQKSQQMITGNILDKKAVEKAVAGCDVVYNFAGMADLNRAHEKPVETIESNVLGNTIILEACRLNKVKRFVFASTIYVYSSAGSFYRSSKQACELIIENYHEVFGLPYTILRYGSLYGPRAGETNWIYSALKQALTEGKIIRPGDGEEVREYIHVEDAARSSVMILDGEYENESVIIAGQQSMKLKDIMVMIKEILQNKIELEFVPASSNLHYSITPYKFNPKIARRLILNSYMDLGQGLLQCLDEVYKKHQK